MQHRRIDAWDSGSVHEPLDERDEYGKGIRVPATYYVFASHNDTRSETQRSTQQKVFDQLQYFFSFNVTQSSSPPVDSTLSSDLLKAGVTSNIKLLSFPTGFKEVMLRVENVAEVPSDPVDLQALAEALLKHSQGGG